MDNKNIFDSVVEENTAKAEAQTVLILHLLVVVTPVTDDDVKVGGLNQ